MHVLYIIILFAIPSLILADKCAHKIHNQRTKRIEVRYVIAVIFKNAECVFLRQHGYVARGITQ